jgi:shikimate dehydrogenase
VSVRPARYGLVGHPVSHSLSPRLFAWLHADDQAGCTYELLDVGPSRLDGFLTTAGRDFHGLNVTVPHKVAVAAMCAERTPAAALTGAVNAVRFRPTEDGAGLALHGDNTDVGGFALALGLAHRPPRVAVVLGAGGAARAVVVALAGLGTQEIRVVNRSPARADALYLALAPHAPGLVLASPEDLDAACAGADLVVQATSAGLAPGSRPPRLPWDRLATDAMAMDLVYRPRWTEFLAAADAAGKETIDGLEMLAGQAVGALAFFRDAPLPADAAVRARALAARLRAAVD